MRLGQKFEVSLAVAALGVVYDDICTSPLYAFRESLSVRSLEPTQASVFGIFWLIFWTIVVVVTVKYVAFVAHILHLPANLPRALLVPLSGRVRATSRSPGQRPRFALSQPSGSTGYSLCTIT
ncbi:MAG: KUP/HAK/KT family potassium transporter [Gammaproteobacteria bacterium]